MNESLKMLTEYVLEENVDMKREIRQLKGDIEKLKEQNNNYFNSNMKLGEKAVEIKNIIKDHM